MLKIPRTNSNNSEMADQRSTEGHISTAVTDGSLPLLTATAVAENNEVPFSRDPNNWVTHNTVVRQVPYQMLMVPMEPENQDPYDGILSNGTSAQPTTVHTQYGAIQNLNEIHRERPDLINPYGNPSNRHVHFTFCSKF